MLEEVSDFYIKKVFREAQSLSSVDVSDFKTLRA